MTDEESAYLDSLLPIYSQKKLFLVLSFAAAAVVFGGHINAKSKP